MSADVRPFMVPSADGVELGTWQVQRSSEWVDLPDALLDWDPLTDLAVRRSAIVDLDRLRQESDIDASQGLALVVEWRASASALVGLGAIVDLVEPSSMVMATLPGDELGGTLRLMTRIVVTTAQTTGKPFTANRCGDILFEDSESVHLQGAASMFPISISDFAALHLEPDARWHLLVPHSLEQPVMGRLRLYINARDDQLVRAASNAGAARDSDKELLRWLHSDVVHRLVYLALSEETALELEDYDEDPECYGGMLRQLIRTLFDDEHPKQLASELQADPGVFATRLQAAVFRMLAGD